MRKVVVTGGSGRLGQFVIRDLLTHGFQVLSLDRVPPRENYVRVGSSTCATPVISSKRSKTLTASFIWAPIRRPIWRRTRKPSATTFRRPTMCCAPRRM